MASWIPVVVAVLSALLAGYFARQTKGAEIQAQRILELEKRIAASRADVFEPMVEAVGKFWERTAKTSGNLPDSWTEKNLLPAFSRFGHWVQIYGSDETVWLYHRFMQAIFADAPSTVIMRLLADLILAARKELGNPDSALNAVDIMGIRINDIYVNGVPMAWASLPESELYENEAWTPPWGDRFA
jgi:hypothetical protein